MTTSATLLYYFIYLQVQVDPLLAFSSSIPACSTIYPESGLFLSTFLVIT